MAKKFLESVYDGTAPKEATELYDAWAASYDAEIQENGYVTPRRCAEALAGLVADLKAPVLDMGCGTGLSGMALRAAGFTIIDGIDVSAEMLAKASEREDLYRSLARIEPGAALPYMPGAHAYVSAAGVISPDHAPPETIDMLLAHLPASGCLAFSLNDHALSFPEFPGKIEEVASNGTARLVFEERGPHLPGIGLEAVVYVLKKS